MDWQTSTVGTSLKLQHAMTLWKESWSASMLKCFSLFGLVLRLFFCSCAWSMLLKQMNSLGHTISVSGECRWIAWLSMTLFGGVSLVPSDWKWSAKTSVLNVREAKPLDSSSRLAIFFGVPMYIIILLYNALWGGCWVVFFVEQWWCHVVGVYSECRHRTRPPWSKGTCQVFCRKFAQGLRHVVSLVMAWNIWRFEVLARKDGFLVTHS